MGGQGVNTTHVESASNTQTQKHVRENRKAEERQMGVLRKEKPGLCLNPALQQIIHSTVNPKLT